MVFLRASLRVTAAAALLLAAACGGGGGSGSSDSVGGSPPPVAAPPPAPVPISMAEAGRFLTQATFGPTETSMRHMIDLGFRGWIDRELATTPSASHLAHVDLRQTQFRAASATANVGVNQVYETWWKQAITGPDQLRQRMAFALSEIFVVSLADAAVTPRGAASYYDMLNANAFGNYRTLLEQVSLHPMMGVYLTHLGNRRADPATGRMPDENYAREVLQLMSIGVHQLNADGTVKTAADGSPLPSYSPSDISNLAAVFTGFSWYHPTPTNGTFGGGSRDSDAAVKAMIAYPQYHALSAKTFLGQTIPATTVADPTGELKVALDTIFNHPNVGPFLSRQLIQRLVTSNPSPAYVGRVAQVFNDNGSGLRGDLAAVTRAILLDAEARNAGAVTSPTAGKLREPVVRLANWARAFNATSQTGYFLIPSTSANTSLGQSPLAAPSVFNFWRPGYSPPNTRMGQHNLVAPEFQGVEEISVAGYVNTMQTAIDRGFGNTPQGGAGADVQTDYTAERALALDPGALVDRVSTLLLYGQMSPTLRGRVLDAVNSVRIAADATPAQIETGRTNRVKLAILLTMASPEYLAQR